ncbi:hypothetical protein M408DRAFT_333414 [Serendipita vermifera MAFF 305830]|uniref:Palmitoyltransferase n=1 Tax=Serendipita vermifera MAFF 305830 TaxID=933852 RepID=A0A0C3AQF7_SERVB|nr:hypothetical protein M408DRAFT_333414 [Serendipita vermifera MAFF 305830]
MSQSHEAHSPATTSTKTKPPAAAQGGGVNVCGPCVKSFERANERADKKERDRTGPKPWLERKFAVGMVIGLFGWSSYVFWGIILRDCWYNAENALVSFGPGIVLTIFYGLFSLMFVLTYLKIILTPPGFARDHVKQSDPPLAPDPGMTFNTSFSPSYNTQYNTREFVYPPSRKAPTSEHRPSMEDGMTHETASADDHEESLAHSATRLNTPGGSKSHENTLGIPYDKMPARPLPTHNRTRTASSTAIPPSTPKVASHQRSNSSTYPPSPSSPNPATKARPAAVRKDSRASTSTIPVSPTPQSKTRSVRAGSTSSQRTTTTINANAHATSTPTTSQSPTTKRPAPLITSGSGFKYESSSYILDPPRLSSQTHSRTSSHVRKPSEPRSITVPFPSNTSPRTATPRTTGGFQSLSDHANVNIAGRTEGFEERPVPYLDDLPPEQPPWWDRKPSDRPILEPYYRYCSRDGIIKPVRSHHCRICNTCVLGYDHHCPWVGGCVGAQNRKFFVVFVFWCTLYLLYTIGLLIASIVSRTNPSRPVTFSTASLNPNIVVLLIASVLFCIFSAGMLGTHVLLLSRNSSTVEWHSVQSMKERERAVISQVVPVCGCLGMSSGDPGNGGLLGQQNRQERRAETGLPKGFKGRVELKKRWNTEWGRIGKEGNLWWLGSNRANWEAVMGKNPWTWFLPVGDMTGVGIDYPRNPRFDEQGRWMRRSMWPKELQ